MIRVALIALIILCTGCAVTPPETTAELNWRKGEVTGTVASMNYVFEGDELTLDLYSHNSPRFKGRHKLHIEDDEVKYKLKYVF